MPSNFNDTTPAAPTGTKPLLNVKWQTDGGGNDSAYYNPSGNPIKQSVSSVSNVLTVDASTANSFRVLLHEPVYEIIINNPTEGQEILFLWIQNAGSGSPPTGWTVDFSPGSPPSPTFIEGGSAPSLTPNSVSVQRFTYDSALTTWFATGAGSQGL